MFNESVSQYIINNESSALSLNFVGREDRGINNKNMRYNLPDGFILDSSFKKKVKKHWSWRSFQIFWPVGLGIILGKILLALYK